MTGNLHLATAVASTFHRAEQTQRRLNSPNYESGRKRPFSNYGTTVAFRLLPEQTPLGVHTEIPFKHEYVYHD